MSLVLPSCSKNLDDGADDHTTEVRCSPDVRRWLHDGFTMASTSCTHELNTKLNHRVSFLYFWHVKDFDAARDGDAEGLKNLPMDIWMGNDALTNGPMSSRSPPNL